ncbi:MAG: hypothetical protein K0S19_784, partial [Geminicoccaceae bacterium]|nr:hypothetical protein [Geminicoccaceae bacterium]
KVKKVKSEEKPQVSSFTVYRLVRTLHFPFSLFTFHALALPCPNAFSTSRSNCTDKLSRFEYGPG